MKYRETESLSLSVCFQISFKSKLVDSGNESFDGVQRGAWNWYILSGMTSERDEKHTVIITVRLYEPHTLLWRMANGLRSKCRLRNLAVASILPLSTSVAMLSQKLGCRES